MFHCMFNTTVASDISHKNTAILLVERRNISIDFFLSFKYKKPGQTTTPIGPC